MVAVLEAVMTNVSSAMRMASPMVSSLVTMAVASVRVSSFSIMVPKLGAPPSCFTSSFWVLS